MEILAAVVFVVVVWAFRGLVKVTSKHMEHKAKVAIAEDRADLVSKINAIDVKDKDITDADKKLKSLLGGM